jgi:mannose-6-phosphate isomerase-like protein (cupin superfamily)
LFTGKHAQLVVMSLRPGEEIGNEAHPNVDQFFRIEQGEARFVLDQKEERLVRDGDAVVIPVGDVPQRDQRLEDDGPEAVYGVLAAESPGWDGAQDQGRGRQGRGGGAPFLKRERETTSTRMPRFG